MKTQNQIMTRNIFILLFCLISSASYSQQLRGTISDLNGKPIPFANIFIQELATGTTSNIHGEYHLDLPEGEWQLHYRYMGYKTKEVKIKMGQNNIEMDIALASQTYQLKEVWCLTEVSRTQGKTVSLLHIS